MQSPSERTRASRRLWVFVAVSIAAAGVACLLLAARLAGKPRYRRFVSRPLPDGSRYTFLYPAHLKRVVEGGGGSSNVTSSASAYTPDLSRSVWDQLLLKVGVQAPSPGENVTVVVIPLKTGSVRDRRYSARFTRAGELRHNEYLVNAQTRTQFNLYHSCPTTAVWQFERNNSVIARSFQLLRPGDIPVR